MKVLIVQPDCRQFRVPLFIELANKIESISILHFGSEKVLTDYGVDEILGSSYSVGSLKWIRDLELISRDYSIIIGMFDPHWVNMFFMPYYSTRKIILWGHGFGKNGVVNRMRTLLVNKADALLTYYNDAKKDFLLKGISEEKIFVANNTTFVENHMDTSHLSEKTFLYVGRLQRRKKLDVFFEIFSNLDLKASGYSITIVGDGDSERTFLMKKAVDLGIVKYVRFIKGTHDASELLSYFSSALCYISPGHVGLGIIHSFAYGVPIYTTEDAKHCPEMANFTQDVTGYMAKSKLDLQRKISEEIKSNGFKSKGGNAYNHYHKHCTMERMVTSFIETIEYVNAKR